MTRPFSAVVARQMKLPKCSLPSMILFKTSSDFFYSSLKIFYFFSFKNKEMLLKNFEILIKFLKLFHFCHEFAKRKRQRSNSKHLCETHHVLGVSCFPLQLDSRHQLFWLSANNLQSIIL